MAESSAPKPWQVWLAEICVRAVNAAADEAAAGWRDVALGALKLALDDFYTPAETEAWLASPHTLLNGATPLALIKAGAADRVLRLIAQLREGNP